MENLSVIQVRDFAIVAIAIMGFIVLLGNVIKVIKEWRKPGMNEAEWRKTTDETITDHEDRIDSLEAGNRMICESLLAIMSHEINGNSIDKLQAAYDNMNKWLINRK